jgi:hypothetical protein
VISGPGELTTITLSPGFTGIVTVSGSGSSGTYTSLHRYLVVGQGNGGTIAQIQEIGSGLVGHIDATVRVDVILQVEPGNASTLKVVAVAGSTIGMTYTVSAENY